jgi:hypothetical protein
MPSVSKKQQRLMGMAYAWAKGEMPGASKSVKDIANSFLKGSDKKKPAKDSNTYRRRLKKLRDFAATKHDNLPEKVSENHILRFFEF